MPNDSSIALALSRVSARFEDIPDKSILALRDISFSIPKGAFVSVIGPSGAGKSTLMRIVLGLMEPTAGTVVRNFSRPAMVFQNYALFPWLSALGNVGFGLRMRSVPRREREKVAREKLHEVGLAGIEHRYAGELSGGMRQRVGLARALALSPDLLVMDEPFSNLDTITAEELKRDILKIWKQYHMTVLMVNHLIPDAVELSDQILIMAPHPGQITKAMQVEMGRPRDTRESRFFKYVDELTADLRELSPRL